MSAPHRLFCAVIVLAACNLPLIAQQGRRGEGGERVALRPEDIAQGRELYNRNCTMCHGLDGAAGDRAPALGATRRYLRRTEQELFDAIKNGIQGTLMPPSPLNPPEVRQIVAYIRALRATAIDVAVPGNPTAGESIFHGKAGCAQCHTIKGRGGIIGPELTNIGAERRLDDLRAALTQPRPIPRGYAPVKVKLKSGPSIEGVIKNEHNFSLQILGLDGKLHLIERAEASSVVYGERSLMPYDWSKRLTAEEFQDLLAFLSRQSRRTR